MNIVDEIDQSALVLLKERFREQLLLADRHQRRIALNALGLSIASHGYTLEIPESLEPDDREALVSGYFTGAMFRILTPGVDDAIMAQLTLPQAPSWWERLWRRIRAL
jgi:hypothetical protein